MAAHPNPAETADPADLGARPLHGSLGHRPVPPVPAPGWTRPVAVLGAASVVAYVSAWAMAGVWHPDYDPVAQSISDLFAVGAPAGPARLLAGVLVVTGLALIPFALALHRALPGEGAAGPAAAAVSGAATVLIVAFPCSPGCPGLGATTTDTGHVLLAVIGYGALVAAPILFARRLRGHDDRLARASLVLGAVAALGLAARSLGLAPGLAGLQQRVYNTVADAWYVLAAVTVIRRPR